jgi:hypothetical protein
MKFIVHIQDVHLNAEAQRNIAAVIRSLADRDLVRYVGLEGAFTKVETGAFRALPDPAIRRVVADAMLADNEISGPVHMAFTAGNTVPVLDGIDDRAAHRRNVDAYGRSLAMARANKEKWTADVGKNESASTRTFNPALKRFDTQVRAYRANHIALGNYLNRLAGIIDHPGPEVTGFLRALTLERNLDYSLVDQERNQLMKTLSSQFNATQIQELLERGSAYQRGEIGFGDFYLHLREACRREGIDLALFPAMNAYTDYALAADRINVENLFQEIIRLEKSAYDRLARTTVEKRLVSESRRLYLTGKLLDFTLTPEEWADYKHTPAAVPPSLKPCEDFYREAEARDIAMAGNLLKTMDRRGINTAVLVTGGFHSDGVEAILRARGAACVTVSPKITRLEGGPGSAYLTLFSREKTPLENIFEGEKLFVAGPPKRPEADLGAVARALALGESWRACAAAFPNIAAKTVKVVLGKGWARLEFQSRTLRVTASEAALNFLGRLRENRGDSPPVLAAFAFNFKDIRSPWWRRVGNFLARLWRRDKSDAPHQPAKTAGIPPLPFQPRRTFRLAQLVTVMEGLNNTGGKPEEYYQDLEKVFNAHPYAKDGERRIETILSHQAQDRAQAVVELITNGQGNGGGWFGVGGKQILMELWNAPDARLVLESSQGAGTQVQLIFWAEGKDVRFDYRVRTGGAFPRGTRFHLRKRFSSEEVAHRRGYIERVLRINTHGAIRWKGENRRLNRPEDYAGDRPYSVPDESSVPPVVVEFSEEGCDVTDQGKGMGLKEIFENYLSPYKSTNAIAQLTREEAADQAGYLYTPGSTSNSDAALWLLGVEFDTPLRDRPVPGLNLVPEVCFLFPADAKADISEDRGGIPLVSPDQRVTPSLYGVKAIINKLTRLDGEVADRWALINTLAAVIRAKQPSEEKGLTQGNLDEATDLLWYLQQKMMPLLGWYRAQGFAFFPNRKEWARFQEQSEKIVLLDPGLFQCTPKDAVAAGLKDVTSDPVLQFLRQEGTVFYTRDFGPGTPEDAPVVMSTLGMVVIDQAVFERERADPEILQARLSLELGETARSVNPELSPSRSRWNERLPRFGLVLQRLLKPAISLLVVAMLYTVGTHWPDPGPQDDAKGGWFAAPAEVISPEKNPWSGWTPSPFSEGKETEPRLRYGSLTGPREMLAQGFYPHMREDGSWESATDLTRSPGRDDNPGVLQVQMNVNMRAGTAVSLPGELDGKIENIIAQTAGSQEPILIHWSPSTSEVRGDYNGRTVLSWSINLASELDDFQYIPKPLPEAEIRDMPLPWRAVLDKVRDSHDDEIKIRTIEKLMAQYFVYDYRPGYLHNGQSWGSTARPFVEAGVNPQGQAVRPIPIVCNLSAAYYYIMARYVGLEAAYVVLELSHEGGLFNDMRTHARAAVRVNGRWEEKETTSLMRFVAAQPEVAIKRLASAPYSTGGNAPWGMGIGPTLNSITYVSIAVTFLFSLPFFVHRLRLLLSQRSLRRRSPVLKAGRQFDRFLSRLHLPGKTPRFPFDSPDLPTGADELDLFEPMTWGVAVKKKGGESVYVEDTAGAGRLIPIGDTERRWNHDGRTLYLLSPRKKEELISTHMVAGGFAFGLVVFLKGYFNFFDLFSNIGFEMFAASGIAVLIYFLIVSMLLRPTYEEQRLISIDQKSVKETYFSGRYKGAIDTKDNLFLLTEESLLWIDHATQNSGVYKWGNKFLRGRRVHDIRHISRQDGRTSLAVLFRTRGGFEAHVVEIVNGTLRHDNPRGIPMDCLEDIPDWTALQQGERVVFVLRTKKDRFICATSIGETVHPPRFDRGNRPGVGMNAWAATDEALYAGRYMLKNGDPTWTQNPFVPETEQTPEIQYVPAGDNYWIAYDRDTHSNMDSVLLDRNTGRVVRTLPRFWFTSHAVVHDGHVVAPNISGGDIYVLRNDREREEQIILGSPTVLGLSSDLEEACARATGFPAEIFRPIVQAFRENHGGILVRRHLLYNNVGGSKRGIYLHRTKMPDWKLNLPAHGPEPIEADHDVLKQLDEIARRSLPVRMARMEEWHPGLLFLPAWVDYSSTPPLEDVLRKLDKITRANLHRQDWLRRILAPVGHIYLDIPLGEGKQPHPMAERYLDILEVAPDMGKEMREILLTPVSHQEGKPAVEPLVFVGKPKEERAGFPFLAQFYLSLLAEGFDDLLKWEPEGAPEGEPDEELIPKSAETLGRLVGSARTMTVEELQTGGLKTLISSYNATEPADYIAPNRLAGAVGNQGKNAPFPRELIQNARDALREARRKGEEIKNAAIRVRSYFAQEDKERERWRWIISVQDDFGMLLDRLVKKVLDPEATTKSLADDVLEQLRLPGNPEEKSRRLREALFKPEFHEDAVILGDLRDRVSKGGDVEAMARAIAEDHADRMKKTSAGFFGWGFFTLFAEADGVVLRTGREGRRYEIKLHPVRENGQVVDIQLLWVREYDDRLYKGTEVQWIKFVGPKDLLRVQIENAHLRAKTLKWVGAVSDVDIYWDGHLFRDEMTDVARGRGWTGRVSGSRIKRWTVDQLHIQDPVPAGPESLWRRLEAAGWNDDSPAPTPVVRTRNAVQSPELYQPIKEALVLRGAHEMWRRGLIFLPGLPPYDQFLKQSPWNEAPLPAQVVQDARFIQTENFDHGEEARKFWRRFQGEYKARPERWLQLMRALADDRDTLYRSALPVEFADQLDALRESGRRLHAPLLRHSPTEAGFAEEVLATHRDAFHRVQLNPSGKSEEPALKGLALVGNRFLTDLTGRSHLWVTVNDPLLAGLRRFLETNDMAPLLEAFRVATGGDARSLYDGWLRRRLLKTEIRAALREAGETEEIVDSISRVRRKGAGADPGDVDILLTSLSQPVSEPRGARIPLLRRLFVLSAGLVGVPQGRADALYEDWGDVLEQVLFPALFSGLTAWGLISFVGLSPTSAVRSAEVLWGAIFMLSHGLDWRDGRLNLVGADWKSAASVAGMNTLLIGLATQSGLSFGLQAAAWGVPWVLGTWGHHQTNRISSLPNMGSLGLGVLNARGFGWLPYDTSQPFSISNLFGDGHRPKPMEASVAGLFKRLSRVADSS